MVMVLLLQLAVTPGGRFNGVPIPVAPVVVMVISGESAVLIQRLRGDVEVAVLLGTTMMVPVALTVPQPPVSGMV